jgi:hypothetical protein
MPTGRTPYYRAVTGQAKMLSGPQLGLVAERGRG